MKFENMPAMFSFLAGFVVCIATMISKMSILNSLIWVFASLLIFYLIGLAIRALFNVILTPAVSEVKEVITENPEPDEFDAIIADDV